MPKKRLVTDKSVVKVKSAQATLHYRADSSGVKLSNVYSQIRGQGHATELMQEVCAYADHYGISLWLEVQRYGNPNGGLDNRQLKKFYQKFGFELTDDGGNPPMMIRKPVS